MLDTRNGEMVVVWQLAQNHRQECSISLSEFLFLVSTTKTEEEFRAALWNKVKLTNDYHLGWNNHKAIDKSKKATANGGNGGYGGDGGE